MIWYIVICSFMGGGDYECDRGESFENYIDCEYHVELVTPVKLVEDAYCEWEADDVRE